MKSHTHKLLEMFETIKDNKYSFEVITKLMLITEVSYLDSFKKLSKDEAISLINEVYSEVLDNDNIVSIVNDEILNLLLKKLNGENQ